MAWRFWARTRPAQFNASEDVSLDDWDAIEPLLLLYGDGMASAAEARLVEAHLPGCESCRESLAWMQATRRALSGRPVETPPASLHARIAEAIAASDAAPLRLRPARTFATRPAFAAAASLAAVGLFLGYSLTHLPPPGTTVKTGPSHSVATLPTPPPSVSVAPIKPPAPAASMKKTQPAPLVADNSVTPDDTLPAPVVVPTATRPARLSSGQSGIKSAVKTAPLVTELRPRVVPRLKPVVPPSSTNLIAVKPLVIVKHTPAPLPIKSPVAVANADIKGTVQVLPPTVTEQEPPASVQIASAQPGEPRVQNVDYMREIRAHLPSSETKFRQTVGMSLRGITTATRTFGTEGGTPRLANITQGPINP